MHVVTLLNEKGGVAKTTLAVTLASYLAIKGNSVILIDSDAQSTATAAFGIPASPGFYDLVARDAAWNEVLVPIDPAKIAQGEVKGKLWLVPGNRETRSINVDNAALLLNRLSEIDVDFVIIDTSPTPSMLHVLIYIATDALVYPTQLETWSVQGLAHSFRHREQYSKFRQSLGFAPIHVLGIVPTMTNLNTLEHAENLRDIRSNAPAPVWRPLHRRILWAETAAAQRSIFAYAPDSEAAKDAEILGNQFMEALHVLA